MAILERATPTVTEDILLLSTRTQDTHTCCRALAMELSQLVLMPKVWRGWDSIIKSSACGASVLTSCTTAAAPIGYATSTKCQWKYAKRLFTIFEQEVANLSVFLLLLVCLFVCFVCFVCLFCILITTVVPRILDRTKCSI